MDAFAHIKSNQTSPFRKNITNYACLLLNQEFTRQEFDPLKVRLSSWSGALNRFVDLEDSDW